MPIITFVLLSVVSSLSWSENPLIVGSQMMASTQMTRATNDAYTSKMARHMGHPIRFQHFLYACDLLTAAVENELDVVAVPSAWAPTLIHSHGYRGFLQTQARLSLVLISRREDPVTSISALKNKTVGKPPQGFSTTILANELISRVEGLTNSITFIEADHDEAMINLVNKRTDALFTSVLRMRRMPELLRSKITFLRLVDQAIPSAVLIAKQQTAPSLLRDFQEALISIPDPLGYDVNFQPFTEKDSDAIKAVFGLRDVTKCME